MEPSELIEKITDWLEGEVKSNDGTCYDQMTIDTFEMGVLAGRLECASGLQVMIQKWEREVDND